QGPVGELSGVIGDPGDDLSSVPAPSSPPKPSAPSPAPEAARTTSPAPAPADAALPPTETYQSRPATTRVVPISGAPSPQPAGASPGRVRASPLAKKIASQSGVDLRMLQGSGPGGRIVRRDVEAAMAAPRPTAQ